MAKGKILIVEDDRDIVEMVEYNLQEEGYVTVSALNGEDGVRLAGSEQPDLIILDIMLPVIDGFEVCRTLKGDDKTSQIPIIILSAKSQETDKVVGLELGADDYVTKPFSPRELIARIRAIMRRGAERKLNHILEKGDLIIDSAKYKVMVEGEEILLTTTEFKLLEYMARRPGVVLSRYQILDAVSGDDTIACDRTVDAHVKSLRRKLGMARDYIETVRGVGYRFREV
ncbi:MAG: response regulator [Phycisphaerae bacterium]|nr:response regulator transcription factor [Phycisphaerae bacterium]NIP54092.1 response regulator transcription factor [Phycisphaerae bacterium]NIS53020.1 response regulator transcription factor [Phycisphaerae bacterium]NIU10502.1 response regulator transcription factor [Phycisphaerae bacterium]NIU58290.1 response regulator [Phycisphaerae bacterium]